MQRDFTYTYKPPAEVVGWVGGGGGGYRVEARNSPKCKKFQKVTKITRFSRRSPPQLRRREESDFSHRGYVYLRHIASSHNPSFGCARARVRDLQPPKKNRSKSDPPLCFESGGPRITQKTSHRLKGQS